MKKLFKKICLLTLVFIIANMRANVASAAVDLHFNGENTVTEMTGDYLLHVELQITGAISLSGLSLLGIFDDNEIEAPFSIIDLTGQLSNAVPSGGNFNLEMLLNLANNPDGHFIQFFLVSTSQLNNVGTNNFNPDNSNGYTVFAPSGIWAVEYSGQGGQGGGGDQGNTAQYQFQSSNTQLVISGDLTLNNGYALITINSLDGNELAAADVSTNGSGVFSHTFSALSSSGIVPGQQYTFTIVNSDNTSQVFLTNQPINFGSSGGGDTGQQDGFNPSQDCYEEAFADTQPCIDFFANGGDYNQNFSLTSSLQNPLGENGDIDIIAFLQKLFNVMVKIALPFLILFAIYSGFMFVEARGNTDKLEVAKKNFLYVIIGAFIIFGAWMIATVLKGTVDDITAMELINDIINLV